MATKKPQKDCPSVATQMFENFIEEGTYPQLKQSEKKVELLTSSMKKRLLTSESKRHEFEKHQLVGRFVAKRIYETDTVSLNEYLFDLGLLLHVVEIDNKKIQENMLYLDMIQDFKLQDTYFIKPSFNKLGKTLGAITDFEVTDQWSLDDMAENMSILKPQVKALSNEYEKLKWNLMKLMEIQQMVRLPKEKRTTIPHKYGSLSVVANAAKYDISAIYDCIGEWLLIEYGTPNSKLLEPFILNGTVSKKELDQFKTMKDIRLDFSVMTLEDERKMLEMLDHKNMTAAANRMGA
jgi:hypothetical protein